MEYSIYQGVIMNSVTSENVFVKSQFTDLFSLFTSCEIPAPDMSILAYSTENLKIMRQNARYVVDVLLNGLQNVGAFIAVVDQVAMNHIPIANTGLFVSAISNLIDALNTFAIDAGYELRQRGVVDYK